MNVGSSNAYQNLTCSIIYDVRIPERVFSSEFTCIYVMNFQKLMTDDAIDLYHFLMRLEGSANAVLATLNYVDELKRTDDLLEFEVSTNSEDYQKFLKHDISRNDISAQTPVRKPWLIFSETIACCSDVGSWCIYGQRFAEIALVAFKQQPDAFAKKNMLRRFGIENLSDALKRPNFFGVAGNKVSDLQRAKLARSYL